MVLAVALVAAAVAAVVPRRAVAAVAIAGALITEAGALALAAAALRKVAQPHVASWLVVDAATAIVVAVIGTIGALSVMLSPMYLATTTGSVLSSGRRERVYYVVLLVFLASLLAVPMAGNLAEAWLLIEATTATSALLVGFSGKPRALEAGWKYLILTSLGLGVALLGIGLLASGVPGSGMGGLSWRALARFSGSHQEAAAAYVLVLAGLAAKVGWAPVHNWLPDAHSEAPPPVSALLSGALLPAVLLVAWRTEKALAPVLGARSAQRALIAFGLASLAVAVPFLWQSLAWKRLLAYSSLEHMGIIALGVGFGTPLALAGVALHIVGHAVAKALGFYAATPLLALEPRSAGHAPMGIGRRQPHLGAAMGISLGALAGLPPSPLFVSELLIIAGGYRGGYGAVTTVAVALMALGFLGLVHALLSTVAGKGPARATIKPVGLSAVVGVAAAAAVVLLALTAAGLSLPGSALVQALVKGAS
jgi:hydrogenase-4 component F